MHIYLIVFFLSAAFMNVAIKSGNKIISYSNLLLAFLLPVLLAAFRDDDVGTDLYTYGIYFWDLACGASSFNQYVLSLSALGSTEIGYCALNWIVSRFSTDIHWFFFVHEALIMIFVFATLWKLRHCINPALVLLFFYFYEYNIFLSMLRQAVAIVIVLYASIFLFYTDRKRWFFVFVAFAMLFHNSVVLVVLLPVMKYLVEKFRNKINMVYLFSVIATLIAMTFFTYSINWLVGHGLVSSKYEMYAEQEGFNSHKINLVLEFVIVLSNYFLISKKRRGTDYYLIQFMAIVCILLELMGGVVEIATRVVMYFLCIVAFYSYKLTDSRNTYQRLMSVYVVFSFVLFVYLSNLGYAGTVPYTSKILGIYE